MKEALNKLRFLELNNVKESDRMEKKKLKNKVI